MFFIVIYTGRQVPCDEISDQQVVCDRGLTGSHAHGLDAGSSMQC